jgi:hypothetical protein
MENMARRGLTEVGAKIYFVIKYLGKACGAATKLVGWHWLSALKMDGIQTESCKRGVAGNIDII